MKTLLYIFLTKIRQVLLLSLFVFMPIALLQIIFWRQPTAQSIATNFALATGFLCVLITASILQPEDTSSLEMMASLSKPFWQTTLATVALCWLMTWLVSGLATIASVILIGKLDLGLLMTVVVGFAAVIFFFGGITLLNVIAGRDSRIGIMVGLLAVAWLFAFPGIISRVATIPSLPIFSVAEGATNPVPWITFRLVYTLAGISCCIAGTRRVDDTDYLLVGAARRSTRFTSTTQKPLKQWRIHWQRWLGVLSKPLSRSVSRNVGLVFYEGMISVIKGPLLITMAVLWFIFGCIVFIGGLRSGGFWPAVEGGATGLLFTLRLFLAVILPFILVATVSAERRTHVDQLMLSLISPHAYLGGKLLGICGGVFISFLLCSLPASLFMIIPALMGEPIYLIGYLGNLFLGIFPFLAYIITISVLTGMLARSSHPLFWGGLAAVGIFAVFLTTAKGKIGNIIFPSGQMVADTIAYPIYVHGGFSGGISYNPEHFLLVPGLYLALPVLSAIVQIILMWLVAGKIYERQVMSV
jgi:hypothetical protein